MMNKNDVCNYQKSCLKMVREFPRISTLMRNEKYAVPTTPRHINVGRWMTEEIENIARELKCVNNYSSIYDNKLNVYVPEKYYNYWGCDIIKIMFCSENQQGYLCWYDEQERKYNKVPFMDIADLFTHMNTIQECE